MAKAPIILGIETSCDETAAALVDGERRILSHALWSQIEAHALYGGVVPEIAARAHVDHLDHLIRKALLDANIKLADVDAIAATAGPGLIGGVMVGVVTAKALAFGANKPFIAINHLEGHALSPRLCADIAFPYLLLLISGGHCQLLIVDGVGAYERLGSTIDDAAGEAFDKTAKLLGLGYPGGPAIEQAALKGEIGRFSLPRPLTDQPGCNFSFSGLKTAIRRCAERLESDQGGLYERDINDLAAATQAAIGDCLINRTDHAISRYLSSRGPITPTLVVAGGVAANATLRSRLETLAQGRGLSFMAPPPWLCTDNGAMIAWAGLERFLLGQNDGLAAPARPRWPLDETAPPLYGTGQKGAKA
ncbi:MULTISPECIES: tRNA (adenosine(37)-N6)-threonylcarbamoyltransferase complex transferase subunit TsaD [unclassified Iodidimonas]|jgi:N6-L-threonylcarbamoyladenine synthase|uniref:tRNA (adenosine(37)-N6)-threonylcarbamoyltransferase complex transferase subunit TsaD n=1 Tax=unclassified Iodidimonas TaxID=2626145 RepID=UPI002482B342|nr:MULTISPECIES: tRNA (adenosine(37)-N6)-threonylcarbamoyltransferase complex transferase subunit TsaD [unclassified Iodidimonas]